MVIYTAKAKFPKTKPKKLFFKCLNCIARQPGRNHSGATTSADVQLQVVGIRTRVMNVDEKLGKIIVRSNNSGSPFTLRNTTSESAPFSFHMCCGAFFSTCSKTKGYILASQAKRNLP